MNKRIFSLLCALLICGCIASPVYAATQPDMETESAGDTSDSGDVSISVSEGVIGFASNTPTEIRKNETNNSSTVDVIGVYPYEIRYDTHNGSPVVIKSFKVPAGFDPAALVETDFEDNGFIYAKKDILKNDPVAKQDSKIVAQTVSFSTEDNEQATIMTHLSPIMDFNEGGYIGQLELDYGSIQSAVSGTTNYSYPIRKTVEYNNLDRNDYAYLDKNFDGLTLQSADWAAMGGSQRGDTIVPSSYNATAVYTGTGYGTKVTGYSNTAIYKGTVMRTYEGEAIYSVIYQGTRIPSEGVSWQAVVIGITIILVIAGLVWLIFTKVIPNFPSRGFKRKGTASVPVALED